jgi:hypothetical protein
MRVKKIGYEMITNPKPHPLSLDLLKIKEGQFFYFFCAFPRFKEEIFFNKSSRN